MKVPDGGGMNCVLATRKRKITDFHVSFLQYI